MDATDVDVQYMHTVSVYDREYQKFAIRNNVHFLPVDEQSADHFDAQHHLFNLLFDNKLIHRLMDGVNCVLDLGYGAANWAIQVAENYPNAQVVGVDVSCHMLPDDMPNNFEPQVNDLNRAFTFPSNYFDIVQGRMIGDGIDKLRWTTLMRDIARILQPGGWCQSIEYYNMIQSDNGSITENHALRRWSTRYMRSIDTLKDPRAPMHIETDMINAGLVEVDCRMILVPLSPWQKDEKDKQIGRRMSGLIGEHLRLLSLYPFTKRLHMPIQEYEQLIRDAVAEAIDPAFKAYIPLYVCLGQKPIR